MADNQLAVLLRQRLSKFPGLDPRAVLAVSQQEGLGGGIGDQGTSYGPFQLHKGGAYPTFAPQDPQLAQQWASSPQGVDYALGKIANVARGRKGADAVRAIVTRFERPANAAREIQGALGAYGSVPSSGLATAAATPGPANPAAGMSLPGVPPQPRLDLAAMRRQLLGNLSTSSGAGDLTGFYDAVGQARQVRAQAAADAKTPQMQDVSHVGTTKAQQIAARLPRTSVGGAIAKTALTQIGIPYQWGGAAKLGSRTDCSGLLQASAAANGVKIGRTTYQQWKQGIPVPLNQLQEGDAVFFHMGKNGPEHVAIYIGDGRVVEDPHTGAAVEISKLAGRGSVGARRFG